MWRADHMSWIKAKESRQCQTSVGRTGDAGEAGAVDVAFKETDPCGVLQASASASSKAATAPEGTESATRGDKVRIQLEVMKTPQQRQFLSAVVRGGKSRHGDTIYRLGEAPFASGPCLGIMV